MLTRMITDLRSAKAIIKILKGQLSAGQKLFIITIPHAVYKKIRFGPLEKMYFNQYGELVIDNVIVITDPDGRGPP